MLKDNLQNRPFPKFKIKELKWKYLTSGIFYATFKAVL